MFFVKGCSDKTVPESLKLDPKQKFKRKKIHFTILIICKIEKFAGFVDGWSHPTKNVNIHSILFYNIDLSKRNRCRKEIAVGKNSLSLGIELARIDLNAYTKPKNADTLTTTLRDYMKEDVLCWPMSRFLDLTRTLQDHLKDNKWTSYLLLFC